MLLKIQPAHMFAFDDATVAAARRDAKVPDGDNLSEAEMERVQKYLFVQLARGYGLEKAISALFTKKE